MTIYEKINILRKRIKDANLKKTGKNAFAGFTYYELADFLPQTIDLENELGLISMFTLRDNESADLVVCDTESDAQVVFTVCVREANMKGALEIQKAGAENTYAKRYAYLNYLNLTEADQVDDKDQSKVIDEKKPVAKTNNRDIMLYEIEIAAPEYLKNQMLSYFKVGTFDELTDAQLLQAHKRTIKELQNAKVR
ncbi:MAG TPA: ERF family protein [Bacteroidales bacterium]|nr:ERF family protein [Bacteroidales bacterium]